jgi:hypothetical protein
VVEVGRPVKIERSPKIKQSRVAFMPLWKRWDFGLNSILRLRRIWKNQIFVPTAPVNETFTPPSHS